MRYSTVELRVFRVGGVQRIKPYQVERNGRTKGRTYRAALRLATYRLKKGLEYDRHVRVSSYSSEIVNNHAYGTASAVVSCRVVRYRADFPFASGEYVVAPSESYVRYLRFVPEEDT